MLTKQRGGTAGGDPGAEETTEEGGRKTSPLFEASLLATAVFLGTNPVAVKYAVSYIPPEPPTACPQVSSTGPRRLR